MVFPGQQVFKEVALYQKERKSHPARRTWCIREELARKGERGAEMERHGDTSMVSAYCQKQWEESADNRIEVTLEALKDCRGATGQSFLQKRAGKEPVSALIRGFAP